MRGALRSCGFELSRPKGSHPHSLPYPADNRTHALQTPGARRRQISTPNGEKTTERPASLSHTHSHTSRQASTRDDATAQRQRHPQLFPSRQSTRHSTLPIPRLQAGRPLSRRALHCSQRPFDPQSVRYLTERARRCHAAPSRGHPTHYQLARWPPGALKARGQRVSMVTLSGLP